MKILTILGVCPQFIKAGSVSREISKHKEIQEIIVHTGQHYDTNMSDIFFDEMKIPKPNYNLNINGLSHGAMTGQMFEKILPTYNNYSKFINEKSKLDLYGDAKASEKIVKELLHMNNNIWIINQYSDSKYHKKENCSPVIAKEFVKLGHSIFNHKLCRCFAS